MKTQRQLDDFPKRHLDLVVRLRAANGSESEVWDALTRTIGPDIYTAVYDRTDELVSISRNGGFPLTAAYSATGISPPIPRRARRDPPSPITTTSPTG